MGPSLSWGDRVESKRDKGNCVCRAEWREKSHTEIEFWIFAEHFPLLLFSWSLIWSHAYEETTWSQVKNQLKVVLRAHTGPIIVGIPTSQSGINFGMHRVSGRVLRGYYLSYETKIIPRRQAAVVLPLPHRKKKKKTLKSKSKINQTLSK